MPDFDIGDGCGGCFTAPFEIFNGLGDMMAGGSGDEKIDRREVIGLSIFVAFISVLALAGFWIQHSISQGHHTVTGVVKQVVKKDKHTVMVAVESSIDAEVISFECDKDIKPEEGVPYEFVLVGTLWKPFREHQSVLQWKRLDEPESGGFFSIFTGNPKMEAETDPPWDSSGMMIASAVVGGIALILIITLVVVRRVKK